jgi:hypothetical protein
MLFIGNDGRLDAKSRCLGMAGASGHKIGCLGKSLLNPDQCDGCLEARDLSTRSVLAMLIPEFGAVEVCHKRARRFIAKHSIVAEAAQPRIKPICQFLR